MTDGDREIVQLLAIGLPVALIVNWLTFGVCAWVTRRNPGIRALIDRRWISLGIAVLSTTFALIAVSFQFRLALGPVVNSLLLVGPVYLLTLVNATFLYLTWKRKW